MNIHRNVSLREGILLGLILIFAAYYFLLHKPLGEEAKQLTAEKAQLSAEVMNMQSQILDMKNMEREMEELQQTYGGKPPQLPLYRNMDAVMNELHMILGDTESYNIQFQGEVKEFPMVRVGIAITFQVNGYREAIRKLEAIEASDNAYLVKNLSISSAIRNSNGADLPSSEQNLYNVSLTLTEFEYEKPTD